MEFRQNHLLTYLYTTNHEKNLFLCRFTPCSPVIYAAPQVFYSIKFQVGINGDLGGGYMGGDYLLSADGPDWMGDVSNNGNETIIMILDN